MFRQPGGFRQRIEMMAQKFREKGATSAERAMTAQELGLPPRFEEAMQRRLGQTGIFVQVGNKYYLSETRLNELQQRGQGGMGAGYGGMGGGMGGFRKEMITLRIIRMVVGLLAVSLIFVNFFFGRFLYLWIAIAVLFVVWIALTIFQIFYLAEARSRRRPANQWGSSNF